MSFGSSPVEQSTQFGGWQSSCASHLSTPPPAPPVVIRRSCYVLNCHAAPTGFDINGVCRPTRCTAAAHAKYLASRGAYPLYGGRGVGVRRSQRKQGRPIWSPADDGHGMTVDMFLTTNLELLSNNIVGLFSVLSVSSVVKIFCFNRKGYTTGKSRQLPPVYYLIYLECLAAD